MVDKVQAIKEMEKHLEKGEHIDACFEYDKGFAFVISPGNFSFYETISKEDGSFGRLELLDLVDYNGPWSPVEVYYGKTSSNLQ